MTEVGPLEERDHATLTIAWEQRAAEAIVTVRATWNGKLLAESGRTILVEGNHYFPLEDVVDEYVHASDHSTFCWWKGHASYFNVAVEDKHNDDAAWFYAEPYDAASDIKGYVAFWRGVEVSGTNDDAPEIRPPKN